MLYLILLIMGLLIALEIYKRNTNLIYKVPGPPSLRVFWRILITSSTFHGLWNVCHDTLNDYYPSACLWLFTMPIVFLRHPDDIQILLKSKTNLEKAETFYGGFKRLNKQGIITSGGKIHTLQSSDASVLL